MLRTAAQARFMCGYAGLGEISWHPADGVPNMSSKPKHENNKPSASEQEKARLERGLVAGLEGTFPASDPVAVIQPGLDGKVDLREQITRLVPARE